MVLIYVGVLFVNMCLAALLIIINNDPGNCPIE